MNSHNTLKLLIILLLHTASATAEITFDHSAVVPLAVQGQKLSGAMQIPARFGTQRGGNLFHSFDTFNIRTGESATFTADGATTAINNVFGRVTGGETSTINGELNSSIPHANLYLINPNGWLLGKHASLSVPAAFHLSAASNIHFTVGQFEANSTAFSSDVLRLATPPQAFGFLNNSGSIELKGAQLHVQTKQIFDVTAGNIAIDKTKIRAKAGDIHLTAIGTNNVSVPIMGRTESATGAIDINASRLNVSGNGAGAFNLQGGDITVSDESQLVANTGEQDTGLKQVIHIRAENLTIKNSSSVLANSGRIGINAGEILVDGAWINGSNFGGKGTVSIKANSVSILNGGMIVNGGRIEINADEILVDGASISSIVDIDSISGKASVSIKANSISVLNGGWIVSANFGLGNVNHVEINAGKILIDGEASGIYTQTNNTSNTDTFSIKANSVSVLNDGVIASNTYDSGNAGTFSIKADSVRLLNGGIIGSYTYATGNAGLFEINAGEILVDGKGNRAWIGSKTYATGNANTANIKADSVSVLNGGMISSTTYASGNAGRVEVNADRILVDGQGDYAWISSDTESSGNAGTVSIKGGSVSVLNGGTISSATYASGNAGHVEVNAGEILVDGQGNNAWIASGAYKETIVPVPVPVTTGNGGTLYVNSNNLTVLNGGRIDSASFGTGYAGSIDIAVSDTLRIEGNGKAAVLIQDPKGHSAITVASIHNDAGNIHINAKNLLYALNSEITTSAGGGKGNGGNIIIDQQPANFVVLNNSNIIANALARGDAGNIKIFPNIFLQSTNSKVQASSPLGAQGTITITGANSNIAGSITALSGAFINTEAVLQEDCRKRHKDNKISTFSLSSMQGVVFPTPDSMLSYAPSTLKDCSIS